MEIELKLEQIRLDSSLQMRSMLDSAIVAEYRDKIEAGEDLGLLEVVQEGGSYWLWDGAHRLEAYKLLGATAIPCQMRAGSFRDALLLAVGANSKHGLRRSNEAKRKAVLTLLEDEEWGKWSDGQIAEQAQVSRDLVSSLRAYLAGNHKIGPRSGVFVMKRPNPNNPDPDAYLDDFDPEEDDTDYFYDPPDPNAEHQPKTRIVTRGGKTYEMAVDNIGKAKKKSEPSVDYLESVATRTSSVAVLEGLMEDFIRDKHPSANRKEILTMFRDGVAGGLVDQVNDYLKSERKVVFNWSDILQAVSNLLAPKQQHPKDALKELIKNLERHAREWCSKLDTPVLADLVIQPNESEDRIWLAGRLELAVFLAREYPAARIQDIALILSGWIYSDLPKILERDRETAEAPVVER